MWARDKGGCSHTHTHTYTHTHARVRATERRSKGYRPWVGTRRRRLFVHTRVRRSGVRRAAGMAGSALLVQSTDLVEALTAHPLTSPTDQGVERGRNERVS